MPRKENNRKNFAASKQWQESKRKRNDSPEKKAKQTEYLAQFPIQGQAFAIYDEKD